MAHAVILAGGGGTRLWPLSRTAYPKQFLSLLDQHSLFQHTVKRLHGLVSAEQLWVVTGAEHHFIVQSQLAQLAEPAQPDTQVDQILVEPTGKNTAAAIGLAALHLQRQDPQAVMIVLPADHWITKPDAFVSLLRDGIAWAEQGKFVTLGIIPDRPETGYGYIQAQTDSQSISAATLGHTACNVKRFVEKPDIATAQDYVSSGQYYWNAGIFVWQASTILEEIATHMPGLHAGLQDIAASLGSPTYPAALADIYPGLESVSIDVGVLEKSAARLVVLSADIGWSDLGEWSTVHRLSAHEGRGNTLRGSVVDIDSEDSFVHASGSSGRTIATIGLKKTIVVDTDDAVLICAQDRVQDVKGVVQQLQTKNAEIVHRPRTVHRPWGTYTVLEDGPHSKVKRISVSPGASLSLQLHHKRSEHWVVISGVAQVTNGEQKFQLQPDQSTSIPQGTRHRLANQGAEKLEIIEVQTGSYLGEDDIVRFADQYNRA
jgi:mannose-1-phosphate guanylyltransferase/mannose-6-phosphate isomerase